MNCHIQNCCNYDLTGSPPVLAHTGLLKMHESHSRSIHINQYSKSENKGMEWYKVTGIQYPQQRPLKTSVHPSMCPGLN